jgi:hypothetical protein
MSQMGQNSPWRAVGQIAALARPNLISVGPLLGVKLLCPKIEPMSGLQRLAHRKGTWIEWGSAFPGIG